MGKLLVEEDKIDELLKIANGTGLNLFPFLIQTVIRAGCELKFYSDNNSWVMATIYKDGKDLFTTQYMIGEENILCRDILMGIVDFSINHINNRINKPK
jgi:hypothetical protein